MICSLGFPKELLSIEKSLKAMPHLKGEKVPDRRFDVVCFARGVHSQHEIYPLLMIECKANRLSRKAVEQVIGYNHYVSSFFVAVANSEEVIIGWRDKKSGSYEFQSGLPSYNELVKLVKPS